MDALWGTSRLLGVGWTMAGTWVYVSFVGDPRQRLQSHWGTSRTASQGHTFVFRRLQARHAAETFLGFLIGLAGLLGGR